MDKVEKKAFGGPGTLVAKNHEPSKISGNEPLYQLFVNQACRHGMNFGMEWLELSGFPRIA